MMLSRDFFESEDYFLERFSRREAFLDLCYLAAYKDRTFKIRGIEVHQKKGQVAKSLRDLAQRWKWSVNTVVKYLNELKVEGKIDTQQTPVIQLITIKMYLVFNTQTDTQNDTQTDTQTDTPIIKNNKDNKEIIYSDANEFLRRENEELKLKLEEFETGEKVKAAKVSKTLGGRARVVFEEYYNGLGVSDSPYYWTSKDAGQMKNILNALRFLREQKGMTTTDDDLITALKYLLDSIHDTWVIEHLSVATISSKFNDIVAGARARNLVNEEEKDPTIPNMDKYEPDLPYDKTMGAFLVPNKYPELNEDWPYTPDTRPDGAMICNGSNGWRWDAANKRWIEMLWIMGKKQWIDR